jgi:hypothetical protein
MSIIANPQTTQPAPTETNTKAPTPIRMNRKPPHRIDNRIRDNRKARITVTLKNSNNSFTFAFLRFHFLAISLHLFTQSSYPFGNDFRPTKYTQNATPNPTNHV